MRFVHTHTHARTTQGAATRNLDTTFPGGGNAPPPPTGVQCSEEGRGRIEGGEIEYH